jgi:hypothetical protein
MTDRLSSGSAALADVPARFVPPTDPRLGPGVLVLSCPICGALHKHGAGEPDNPAYGVRRAHCKSGPGGSYNLVPMEAAR